MLWRCHCYYHTFVFFWYDTLMFTIGNLAEQVKLPPWSIHTYIHTTYIMTYTKSVKYTISKCICLLRSLWHLGQIKIKERLFWNTWVEPIHDGYVSIYLSISMAAYIWLWEHILLTLKRVGVHSLLGCNWRPKFLQWSLSFFCGSEVWLKKYPWFVFLFF